MPLFEWLKHRTLDLGDENLALLAERSSGWCIVSKRDYSVLNVSLPATYGSSGLPQPLTSLWESGLLSRDGMEHPDSRYSPSKRPSSILLKLTGSCNIECSYCYDYDSKRFTAQQTLASVKATLAPLLEAKQPLSVAFHGGEPLLKFNLMRDIVEWLKPHTDHVGFSVQTNATRFTGEILDFFEENDFSVGISLDGLSNEANAHRITPRGISPLEGTLQLMRDHPDFVRRRCGFLAVASRTSVAGLPAYAKWLQDHGVKGLSITFLDLAGRGKDLASELLSPEEAVELYSILISMIRTGEIATLGLRNLIARMHNLFMLQSRDMCYRGPCGAASDFLVLDAEGGHRTCDCVYDPYFELERNHSNEVTSNLPTQRSAIIDRHEWLREASPTCSSCSLFGLCGGTCVAKAIVQTGTDRSVDPVECALSQYLYPELLREFIAPSRPLFDYYSWHEERVPSLD